MRIDSAASTAAPIGIPAADDWRMPRLGHGGVDVWDMRFETGVAICAYSLACGLVLEWWLRMHTYNEAGHEWIIV